MIVGTDLIMKAQETGQAKSVMLGYHYMRYLWHLCFVNISANELTLAPPSGNTTPFTFQIMTTTHKLLIDLYTVWCEYKGAFTYDCRLTTVPQWTSCSSILLFNLLSVDSFSNYVRNKRINITVWNALMSPIYCNTNYSKTCHAGKPHCTLASDNGWQSSYTSRVDKVHTYNFVHR